MPLHPSHRALNIARGMLGDDVEADWVPTMPPVVHRLADFDGIWLVPGGPYVDEPAACAAVTWARTRDVPFLGTCSGLQYAVLEYFRNVLGVADASHAESHGADASNVITALACPLQGEERLVRPVSGTRFDRLVGGESFLGMHYCSYAPPAQVVDALAADGMVVEAMADDAGAEVLVLPACRFFVLSQFQPHVGVLAGEPLHPLLSEFVRCARAHAEARPTGGSMRRASASTF
jgi:CTP synthase (UTP-ammonia lyase)